MCQSFSSDNIITNKEEYSAQMNAMDLS